MPHVSQKLFLKRQIYPLKKMKRIAKDGIRAAADCVLLEIRRHIIISESQLNCVCWTSSKAGICSRSSVKKEKKRLWLKIERERMKREKCNRMRIHYVDLVGILTVLKRKISIFPFAVQCDEMNSMRVFISATVVLIQQGLFIF